MKTIKSFLIDHDDHGEGFYLSGVQGNIYTYDLRFKKPNGGDYLSTAVAHTIEHLFATVIRNSLFEKNVVYFGPMGCRTGFYLLLTKIKPENARLIVENCLNECLKLDTIPGNSRKECGNYLDHDLAGAKAEITRYLDILRKSV